MVQQGMRELRDRENENEVEEQLDIRDAIARLVAAWTQKVIARGEKTHDGIVSVVVFAGREDFHAQRQDMSEPRGMGRVVREIVAGLGMQQHV